MKSRILFLFFLPIFVLSCSKKHETITLVVGANENCLIVRNSQGEPISFSIFINDLNPASDVSIFEAAGGDLFTPNSLDKIMQFFNYVCDNTYHKNYKTSSNILYEPSIAISSLGGGLCSVRSGVLTNLLRMNGFNADSYVLSGHVITVVNFEGRNIVLDPDFGLWYYDENGLIATYEDLCSNSKLITNPINPVLNSSDADYFIAYSFETAELYSTIADNSKLNLEYLIDDYNSDEFLLPPHSVLEFPIFPSINPNRYGFAKIYIPAGITGTVSAPLIFAYISGKCVVEKMGRKIIVNEDFWFNDSDVVSGELKIIDNKNGIKIYYYLNPLIYCFNEGEKVSLVSKSDFLPEVMLKSRVFVENFCCSQEDLLDFRIRKNIEDAVLISDGKKIDAVFDSFISVCKSDSLLSKYFIWDSLVIDFKLIYLKSDYQMRFESLEFAHPELLRRFLSNRFIEKYYFTDLD